MRHSRRSIWLIGVLLIALTAPSPRLASALLTPHDPAKGPIGARPPELRGRNRIGDVPIARTVSDEVRRREPRWRERPARAQAWPSSAPKAPILPPDRPGPTARIALHLRC